MRLQRWVIVGLMIAGVGVARPSEAGLAVQSFRGHLAVGYGKLFTGSAPGGSLSIAGGIDYPLTSTLASGVDVGYHLLGSRTEVRGSLLADVDYSLFEATALLHWTPPWSGPVGRLSAGAGMFNARADLSTSGGGIGFSDLAVGETVPGLAFGATLVSRKPSPLRLGLELSGRMALVEDETWTVGVARIAVHY
ncbi:MAG TPA: hypothetical protein VEY91_03985 [Candidatus Limnocylindria bacterium]|nr:hypothetical protein [Candidatus Limnocylindria bacterium]